MHAIVSVAKVDDLRAELAMIDENLMRSEYTPAQQSVAIARRNEIYEEVHPEAQHGGDRRSNQVAKSATWSAGSFATATAKASGKSERTIREAQTLAKRLGDDLNEIAETCLDKGVELDALAKREPAERRPLIERAKAGSMRML